jgi:hypothetical protein
MKTKVLQFRKITPFIVIGLILFTLGIFSCKRNDSLSTVTTKIAADISFTTAVSGGEITSDGGAWVLTRGVCWSLNENPTISDNKTMDGEGIGKYESTMNDLIAGQTYYLRAYATNNEGTAYGSQESFTTIQVGVPTLQTTAVTNITRISVVLASSVTGGNGESIDERGFCFSLSPHPTIFDQVVTSGSGTGVFSNTISGLRSSTPYYVRSYAKNYLGIGYGAEISLITLK